MSASFQMQRQPQSDSDDLKRSEKKKEKQNKQEKSCEASGDRPSEEGVQKVLYLEDIPSLTILTNEVVWVTRRQRGGGKRKVFQAY